MSEWWTYQPEDFLLFSPRIYWRMFELHNAALWPLHIATLAAGLAIFLSVHRRPRGPFVAIVLGAAWLFVSGSFLWNRYSSINWAIAYFVPAFVLQALLLAIGSTIREGFAFDRSDATGRAGLLLAVAGLLAYPLLPPLFDRPWTSAEAFGIAPDPTAIFTLGLLLLSSRRFVLILFPIPLVWLLSSGIALLTMGDPQGWLPLSAAGIAAVAIAARPLAGVR